jgi:hypothetical protein
VTYGPGAIERCVAKLSPDILPCLTFLREHVEQDVGHTKVKARELEALLGDDPTRLTDLVAAGSEALDAYAQFLTDCRDLSMLSRRVSM